MNSGIPNVSLPASLGEPVAKPSMKATEAARQFEGLLITQMLRIARESGAGSWFGSADDQSSSTALEFAEQQFASLLANGGGFGLTSVITKGLAVKTESTSDDPPQPQKL